MTLYTAPVSSPTPGVTPWSLTKVLLRTVPTNSEVFLCGL